MASIPGYEKLRVARGAHKNYLAYATPFMFEEPSRKKDYITSCIDRYCNKNFM